MEAVWPSSAAEARDAAAEAARNGADVVVAMGGDGMVHHVSQGVIGTDTALGVIPVGTTNVFARLLKIPGKPTKAARLVAAGVAPRRLGVARLRLRRGTTETTHYAIFACGFGLDAAVVLQADKDPYRKYRFGSVHYAATALAVGLKDFPSKDPHVNFVAGDRDTLGTAALIQFREVYTYFGQIPLRLAPGPPDPMTVLTLGKLRRHRIPQIIGTAVAGRDLASVPEMDTWHGVGRLALSADPPVAVQADGEALGMADGGTVDWVPDSLLVLTPVA